MTTGFYAEIKKGLSYDVSQGQVGQVLRAYYMNRAYEDNREKIKEASVNSRKLMLLLARKELTDLREALNTQLPEALKKNMESRASMLENQIAKSESEILDPAVGGTAVDRQIAYLVDMAANLGQDISSLGDNLERHQKDLANLNIEWELASKDKLPKSKNRSVRPASFPVQRDLYDPVNPDKVPLPINDVDKPTKLNSSEVGSPTTLSDLLQLQNKIQFQKMEMMTDLFEMELSLTQAKASIVAMIAYRSEANRGNSTNVQFGVENLERVLENK
jgi:hypothetical protein